MKPKVVWPKSLPSSVGEGETLLRIVRDADGDLQLESATCDDALGRPRWFSISLQETDLNSESIEALITEIASHYEDAETKIPESL